MITTFVIARHGNTFADGEVPRRIGVHTDLPLVPSGRAQATRLGAWLAGQDRRVSRILSSPLQRTRETAEIVRAMLPEAPVIGTSDLLAEIDHGPDENQPEASVLNRIGQAALDEWDKEGTPPPGWIVHNAQRIADWRTLFEQPDGETTLLVTSNGAARFALLADPRLTARARALPSLKLRTGAFGIIDMGAELCLRSWDQRP